MSDKKPKSVSAFEYQRVVSSNGFPHLERIMKKQHLSKKERRRLKAQIEQNKQASTSVWLEEALSLENLAKINEILPKNEQKVVDMLNSEAQT